MSGSDIVKMQNNNLLNAVNELVQRVPLDDVVTTYNSKTGTASITGNRNGVQYSTTLSRYQDGVIQTNTMFRKDMGRDAMALNIKQLKQEGYTQTEIASMLGISQPTVSNYLRR